MESYTTQIQARNSWKKLVNYRSSGRNPRKPIVDSFFWTVPGLNLSCVWFHSKLRTNEPLKFIPHWVKCHKINIDLPHLYLGITIVKYTIPTLALVSYLWSSVARALHRHSKSVRLHGCCGRTDSWLMFFNYYSWLKFECMIPLEVKTHWTFKIYPTSSEVPQNQYRPTIQYNINSCNINT